MQATSDPTLQDRFWDAYLGSSTWEVLARAPRQPAGITDILNLANWQLGPSVAGATDPQAPVAAESNSWSEKAGKLYDWLANLFGLGDIHNVAVADFVSTLKSPSWNCHVEMNPAMKQHLDAGGTLKGCVVMLADTDHQDPRVLAFLRNFLASFLRAEASDLVIGEMIATDGGATVNVDPVENPKLCRGVPVANCRSFVEDAAVMLPLIAAKKESTRQIGVTWRLLLSLLEPSKAAEAKAMVARHKPAPEAHKPEAMALARLDAFVKFKESVPVESVGQLGVQVKAMNEATIRANNLSIQSSATRNPSYLSQIEKLAAQLAVTSPNANLFSVQGYLHSGGDSNHEGMMALATNSPLKIMHVVHMPGRDEL